MFGDRVNTTTNTGSSGAANATFPAATAGNLLVFTVTRSAATLNAADVFSTPSGWATLPAANDSGDNMAAGGWYKIAAGGETSVTLDGTNESGNWTAIVNEYEGAFDATPLDVVAEDESNTATAVTSQASGTTATTAQNDELAVAYFGIDNGGNFGTKQYSNSFTEQGVLISGARAGSTQATRVLTATGTYSTTLSYSAGGSPDEMYGAIATFKKAVSGGIVEPIGLVTESDTAQAVARLKTRAIGQAGESDTAQPLAAEKTRALAQPVETEQVFGLTAVKTRAIGLVTEVETVFSLEVPGTGIGLVTESNTVFGLTAVKTRAVGLLAEADTVTGLATAKTAPIGLVTEGETAQALTLHKTRGLALLTENDVIFSLTTGGLVAGSVVELADTAVYLVELGDAALYLVALADTAVYDVAAADAIL